MDPAPTIPVPTYSITLRVRRWGDALALVLPKEVARDLGLNEHVLVDVRVRKRRAR